MFTGIVTAVGDIVDVRPQAAARQDAAGVRLAIEVDDFLRPDTRIGDSIAIQGACMTVIELQQGDTKDQIAGRRDRFQVDVSRESLQRTVGLDRPGRVNLEHALRMGDTLDGHLVSGHVDGIAHVTHFAPVGESWTLRLRLPTDMAKYMAYKGSITVNGVSLTINEVMDKAQGCEISINLIPHTLEVTTLNSLQAGQDVNIEIDMIARYVERMVSLSKL